jgi:anti-anti-sigma factor
VQKRWSKDDDMIETQRLPDASYYLRPFGELDWIGAMSLRHVMHDLVQPGVRVDIDLSEVSRIDAVGLSALVGSIRRVRAVCGEIRLSNPRLRVRRRLELAGIYHLSLCCPLTSGDDAA